MALLGVLAWADAQGWLLGTPDFAVGPRTFTSQAACLVGVAAMMHLNRTRLRTAQDLHLQEARQRLQALLDRDLGHGRLQRLFLTSPTPIFVQSAQTGRILDVNPACERVLGYAREELVDKRDGFLWVQDPQYERFVSDRRSALRTEWRPVTAIRRGGERLPVLICRERDEDPQEKLVITFLRLPDEHAAAKPLSAERGAHNASWRQHTEGRFGA